MIQASAKRCLGAYPNLEGRITSGLVHYKKYPEPWSSLNGWRSRERERGHLSRAIVQKSSSFSISGRVTKA